VSERHRVRSATNSAMPGLLALLLVTSLPGAVARAQTGEGLGVPPPAPGGQIDATKLSKIPKLIRFVEAVYPPAAAEQGLEAEVVLLLDINAQGRIDSATVAEPAKPPGMGFDEAAVAAARQFEFEPAEVDGKPIAVQLSYRYKFKLAPKAPPAPAPDAPGAPGTATAPAAAPEKIPVVNFTGQLRERGTRLAMTGVLVTVFREREGQPPEGYEATSDQTGRFKFFDLAAGEWKVNVEAPGYYPFRTTETVAAGEALEVTYYVERGSYNPFDVTVTAQRPRKEVSRTVLSAKEIDKVPGTFGDPLAVIQNFAGVAHTPIAGLIIVRGSAPEDSQVFVDGAAVPLIYHFFGLRSVIPVGLLDSIEFYPGNFSPMYGRATGGIIDVQMKQLQPPKIGGYVDLSLLDGSLYLEAPLAKKGGVAVGVRRSWVGDVIKAVAPSDGALNVVTVPRYYDAQLLVNYRPTPAHDLRLMVLGSDDKLELLFNNPVVQGDVALNSITNSTSFYRSLFTYRYVPGGNFENTARLSQGRDQFAIRAGPFIIDVDTYLAQFRDTARYKFADWLTLVSGLDVLWAKTDFLVQLPRPPKEGDPQGNFDPTALVRSEQNDDIDFLPAAYLELELSPLPGLMLLPGLRVDYFSGTEQVVAQPRFTTRWQLRDTVTAKGGIGLFVQQPDPNQGELDPNFGNPNLEVERAVHYSLGVELKPREHLTFDVTGFHKRLSSLVSQTDEVVTVDGMPRMLNLNNAGKGRVWGMEVSLRHEFANNFTGWLAYTLSRATRRDSGEQDRLFDFDQTHILTVVGSYLLPRNWQLGGRFRLVTGNPHTPVVGAVFNASDNEYDPVYGEVNSRRIAPFHQLDIRVDKRWVYQGWMLNVYLDLQNVYNRANPEGEPDYNFNYRKSKPQQGLPLLSILGIRAEY
jgi:TonB family protein